MWEHIGAWYDESTGRVGGEVGGLEKDYRGKWLFCGEGAIPLVGS